MNHAPYKGGFKTCTLQSSFCPENLRADAGFQDRNHFVGAVLVQKGDGGFLLKPSVNFFQTVSGMVVAGYYHAWRWGYLSRCHRPKLGDWQHQMGVYIKLEIEMCIVSLALMHDERNVKNNQRILWYVIISMAWTDPKNELRRGYISCLFFFKKNTFCKKKCHEGP